MKNEDIKLLVDSLKTELLSEIHELRSELRDDFQAIRDEIVIIKKDASNALKKSIDNELEIQAINDTLQATNERIDRIDKEKVDDLNNAAAENSRLNIRIAAAEYANSQLIEKVEDCKNRQMRKTLIFKGVPELANESWDKTERLLAEKIAEASNNKISKEDALTSIERAHRSGAPNNAKKGKRDIISAFYDWRDSEDIKSWFSKKNSRDATLKVYCEQKFAPTTTSRRNLALLERKTLKAEKTIAMGFITYPAKLMVKYNAKDKNYTLHADFSTMPVEKANKE